MKLIIVIIIAIIIFIAYYLITHKINIHFKTFFRKGFKTYYNEFGLFCYTGKQGTGKTYSVIRFIKENIDLNNSIIITNIHSLKLPNIIYCDDIMKIIDLSIQIKQSTELQDKKLYIFFDEIFTIIEKNNRLSKEILSFLSQLRKREIVFLTTAQEWSEINITFRRYVRYQISCRIISFPFLHFAIFINSLHDGDTLHWDGDKQEFVADLLQTNIYKGNSYISNSYDTWETIKVSQSK